MSGFGPARLAQQWPGFPMVFFDCDSTLVAIEGIDELAKLKGLGDEVYIEDSGLAAVLPLVLSPASAARLTDPALAAAMARGLAAIREGRVRFRDPAMRERLLAAHSRAA